MIDIDDLEELVADNGESALTECVHELANHVDAPSSATRLRGIADGFSCVIGG